MNKYYLVHTVVDPNPNKILNILKDGCLYANILTKQFGLYYDDPLEYVYFSLLGDIAPFHGGFNFILDVSVLFRRSFRYALKWVGDDISNTVKINPKYHDVSKILDFINHHIISSSNSSFQITSHEILLKKKVKLHKYLVAVCCSDELSPIVVNHIKKYYPNVFILTSFPNSASSLNYGL